MRSALLQPGLSVRLDCLERIRVETSADEALVAVAELLSSKYDEKAFKAALLTCLYELVDKVCLAQGSALAVVDLLEAEWSAGPSRSRGAYALAVLNYCSTLPGALDPSSPKLRPLLLSVLEYLYFSDPRGAKKTHMHAQAEACSILKALPALAAQVFSPDAMGAASIGWLVVISQLLAASGQTNETSRAALLGEVSRRLGASKVPLTQVTGLATLLHSLTQTEWAAHLEGALGRMIKKAPESASPLVAAVLALASEDLDLSAMVRDGMAASALRLVRSASHECVACGADILARLAQQCASPEAFASLVSSLLDAVQGKGGLLTSPEQKTPVAAALLDCAKRAARTPAVLGGLAGDCVRVIVSALERETDPLCQPLLAMAAAHWLALHDSKDAVAPLAALMKKSKSACTLALAALSRALKLNPSLVTTLATLEGALVEVVRESTKRPQQAQLDGTLALHLLLKLSLHDPKGGDVLAVAKLWPAVSSATSFLYSAQNVQAIRDAGLCEKSDRSAPRDYQNCLLCSAADTLRMLAERHPTHLASAFDPAHSFSSHARAGFTSSGLHALIVALALQEDFSARTEMASSLQALFRCSQTAAVGSIVCMRHLLDELAEASEATEARERATFQKSTDVEAGPVKRAGDRSGTYLQGLALLVRSVHTLDCAVVANSLVAVCSPVVSGESSRSALLGWRALALPSKLSVLHEDLPAFSRLFFELLSSPTQLSRGVHRVLLLLGLHSGDVGLDILDSCLLPQIVAGISADRFKGVSESDVTLYMNPVLECVAEAQVSAADIKITNEDRKKSSARSTRKGQFGADLVEDEDWAEQIKLEKAKKIIDTKKSESAELLTKRSKELEEVRGRLDDLVGSMRGALEALEYLARHCPEMVCGKYAVVEALVVCMEFQPVSAVAYRCVCLVVVSLEPCTHSFSLDIANALRIIHTCKHKQSEARVLLDGPLARVVKGMQGVVGKGVRLAAVSLHLVYLVLEYALLQQTVPAGCELAFMVLDHCWPDARDDSRAKSLSRTAAAIHQSMRPLLPRMLLVCLHALARFRIEPSPESVLLRMASSVSLYASEWDVILGDLGVLASEVQVRIGCLKAILCAYEHDTVGVHAVSVSASVWLSKNYDEDAVTEIASKCWDLSGAQLSTAHIDAFFVLLSSSKDHVSRAAAKAIGNAMASVEASVCKATLASLLDLFVSSQARKPDVVVVEKQKSKVSIPLVPRKAEEDTKWALRKSVCKALETCCLGRALNNEDEIESLLRFALTTGVVDPHAEVRDAALTFGLALIEAYGSGLSARLYAIVDAVLSSKAVSANESHEVFDYRHEAAVVLLGGVGKHLDKDDPHVVQIAGSLMAALSTPSERVQRAVADCLWPLVAVLKTNEHAVTFLETLMTRLSTADSYGERRGAAFGLSAVVKGLGISSLKQFDIVGRLRESCAEGTVGAREGSLFAFECLSDRLGLLFEPSVIPIVPILLKSFSHSSDHVRDAAHMAAKVIIGKLSAHGVKQVLNPILASLPEESQWKSRQESIRLLGAMAHLSPKSLATSLPQIIPRLVEAGNDVHPKVKESARSALLDISSVIKNPEVAELSPILLEAIADPANKTKQALEVLLACEFMHSIDAPSLALLVPILARALKDRSADVKRKSSAIMGNITSMLSEPKIVCPYLVQIMPGLKDSLLDPIPDVRTMSAKALGSLLGGVGEEECPDLIPWLMDTLKGEDSPAERSGAAQGLAEVCLVLGSARLHEILTDVLKYRFNPKSAAREGLLWLLSFLPAVLNEAFAEHISTTLPVVVVGLSDTSEAVREVAMRAGRIMVQCMGDSHSMELLPALRGGIFDVDYRIRHSSVVLLGELLYLLGDTKAVGFVDMDDDDDGGGFESVSKAYASIRSAVGETNFSLVLASIYTVRFDSTTGVRQTALQIWKSIVNNTPRTLVEIMPTLVDLVVKYLSSDVYDLRIMASRCLGEIVKKLGNKVLTLLVPCLKEGLESEDKHTRQGVCLGLSEMMSALSKQQVEMYVDSFVPSLHQALCDEDDEVRTQAASAFQTLSKCIGSRAIDEVVPALVEQLSIEGESSTALLGLKEVVQLRPRDLLEYLLPKLLKSPIDAVSAKVLATVARATGQYLHHHITLIVHQLVHELIIVSKESDEERLQSVMSCAGSVMGSFTSSGIGFLISELGKHMENDNDSAKRRWSCWLMEQFLLNTQADFSDFIPVILKFLLSRVADRDRDVLVSLLGALIALSNSVTPDEYSQHIDFISSSISSAASDARFRTASSVQVSAVGEYVLPLFTVPKSLDAFIPMLLHALTNGSTHGREAAATVIGELVTMCDAEVLKPFLIKITGPLIRVVGDRFPSAVKAAILETLHALLDRGGSSLKAFAPQLQTTFVKSLNDPTKQVRAAATSSLNQLVSLNLTARVDPLISELSTVISQSDSSAIKASVLDALASVLKHSASKASQTVLLDKVEPILLLAIEDSEDSVRLAAVGCLGGVSPYLPSERVSELITSLLSKKSGDASAYVGRVLGGVSILCNASSFDDTLRLKVFEALKSCFRSEDKAIRLTACSGVCLTLSAAKEVASSVCGVFSADICRAARDVDSEVCFAAIRVIKLAAKLELTSAKKHIGELMQPLIFTIQDAANIKVKYTAERAMYYLLEGGSNPAVLNAYAASASGQDIAFVKDYAKRILSKQPADSDDEDGKW